MAELFLSPATCLKFSRPINIILLNSSLPLLFSSPLLAMLSPSSHSVVLIVADVVAVVVVVVVMSIFIITAI